MTPPFLFTSDLPAKGSKDFLPKSSKIPNAFLNSDAARLKVFQDLSPCLLLGIWDLTGNPGCFPVFALESLGVLPLCLVADCFLAALFCLGGVFELAYSSIQENRCIVSWFSFPSLPILCFQTLHLVVNKMVLLSKEIKT